MESMKFNFEADSIETQLPECICCKRKSKSKLWQLFQANGDACIEELSHTIDNYRHIRHTSKYVPLQHLELRH